MELLIFFLIGMITDRWIIPVVDMLLELLNYHISSFANGVSLKTQREQLKFQQEVENVEGIDMERIGFQYPSAEEDYYEEEYDDDDRRKYEEREAVGSKEHYLKIKK